MEGTAMKRFWQKQLPAALLALVMMISLVPAAMAEGEDIPGGGDTPVVTPGEGEEPPHKHSYSEEIIREATCTEKGQKKLVCSCGETETVDIDELGHDFSDWDVKSPATCESDGSTERKCSRCGETETQRIPAIGHDWENVGTRVEATCTTDGSQPQVCKNDPSHTRTEVLKATGHSFTWSIDASYHQGVCKNGCGTTVAKAAHKDSNSDGKCDTCGYSMTSSNYTVNYYYPSTSLSQQRYTPSGGVPANGYAASYAPSVYSSINYNGTTYTFKGWSTYASGSQWYLAPNAYIISNWNSYRVTSAANFYAIYEADDDAEITVSVDAGKEESFDEDEFRDAYRSYFNSKKATLNYVTFTVSSSTYKNFSGDLYVGSTKLSTSSELQKCTFYYDEDDANSKKNEYALSDLTLRADKNAKDDSITLSFKAYGSASNSYMSGTVKLEVGDAAGDTTIVYKVAPGKTVDFSRTNFNDVYQTEYSGNFSYVVFDKPSSSAFADGTLYSGYTSSSKYTEKFTRNDLNDAYFYYSGASGSNSYNINTLTFVADSDFEDTIKLSFTVYGSSSKHVDGTVEIRSTESADGGDITLTVTPGKSVELGRSTFQTFLRKSYKNADLDYVTFDRPSSSSVFSNGTLYSSYGSSKQVSFTQSNLSSYTFYYNSKDATGSKEYALDTLSFVAGNSFKDSIKLTFTAYGDDDEEVEGTLVIKSDGTTAVTSGYVGSIRYTTTTGTKVQINANDIARYFKKNTGAAMQYVMLGGVPTTGSLYYNYYNTSKYGTTTRAQLTTANVSGQAFYASPTTTSQFALTELTYIPSGTNYCASIPFTAYGNSRSVSGAILISVNTSTVAEVYGMTPKNTAVTFPASSISSAVVKATGSSPASIQLLSLPAYNAGAVYVGTGTTTLANTTTAYAIFSSGGQSLRFVPSTSYTGSVEIPYVALNSSGTAIASGTFSLGVVNNKKSFSDVTASTWCYKYVAELSDASVIDGYSNGSFKPNSTVTYGAALKLIMLAAGYPEQAPTSSNVFSGYLAKARADGIVTRSNIDLTKPITRLQVAQLAAGAMKLDTNSLSSVKPFTDTSDAAVQALNAAGIVEGYFSNGTSTFKPNNTLTRGQVSAIVWRMRNYNK